MGAKPLRIRLDEIDRFIKIDDRIRHLALSDYEWLDKVCDRIKYFIRQKSGITDSINHKSAKIRIDSYKSLPIKNILTFHSAIILFKSVVNKNKTEYYYNIFLEKGFYKDESSTEYF